MKRLTVATLFGLSLLLPACFIIDPCRGVEVDKFWTLDFETDIQKVQIDPGSDPLLSPVEADTLHEGELGIWMVAVKELYTASLEKRPSFSVVSSAYACSVPPEPFSDEVILDIQITSDTDFDAGHPAGSNLADLFSIAFLQLTRYNEFRQIALEDFILLERNAVDELILILEAQPEQTGAFQFTVNYTQEGERLTAYEYTTPTVVLQGR